MNLALPFRVGQLPQVGNGASIRIQFTIVGKDADAKAGCQQGILQICWNQILDTIGHKFYQVTLGDQLTLDVGTAAAEPHITGEGSSLLFFHGLEINIIPTQVIPFHLDVRIFLHEGFGSFFNF